MIPGNTSPQAWLAQALRTRRQIPEALDGPELQPTWSHEPAEMGDEPIETKQFLSGQHPPKENHDFK